MKRRQTYVRLVCIAFIMLYRTHSVPAQIGVATQSFRVDVVSVSVNVTVSDQWNRYVTGLGKENFRIFEDEVEQTITHFTQESCPITMGLLFDISRSMTYSRNFQAAQKDLIHILRQISPQDEFFLINFNKSARLVQDFTNSISELQNGIARQKPGGWTALYDAVYLGLDQVKRGRWDRKAIVLFTDGEDNSSRYRATEVRELCKESGHPIYAIALAGPEGYGVGLLRQLTSLTGGRIFVPSANAGFNGIGYYVDLIQTELRNQYVLGYSPSNADRREKWREIKVRVDTPRGFPKISVRAKKGYYSAPN